MVKLLKLHKNTGKGTLKIASFTFSIKSEKINSMINEGQAYCKIKDFKNKERIKMKALI